MTDFNALSRKAYDKKASNYDNTFDGKFTKKFKQLLANHVDVVENYSVLDVGCGNGSLLAAMSKSEMIRGYGVDISDEMVKTASEKYPQLEFRVAECEQLPFGDATMDAITVCAAYHHFPDVDTFAKEAARVLKPQSYIYIAEIYLPKVLRIVCNPFLRLSGSGDVKFYSPEEIGETFGKAGFGDASTTINGNVQIIKLRRDA